MQRHTHLAQGATAVSIPSPQALPTVCLRNKWTNGPRIVAFNACFLTPWRFWEL